MVTFKGETIQVEGETLQEGDTAPDFELVGLDLQRVHASYFEGQNILIYTFPSVDTSVCQKSIKIIEEKLGQTKDLKCVYISKDLPFAQARYGKENHLENALFLSAFDSSFAKDFGLLIGSGPLKGLLTRTLILIGSDRRVLSIQQVPEISDEPNYGQIFEQVQNHFKG